MSREIEHMVFDVSLFQEFNSKVLICTNWSSFLTSTRASKWGLKSNGPVLLSSFRQMLALANYDYVCSMQNKMSINIILKNGFNL